MLEANRGAGHLIEREDSGIPRSHPVIVGQQNSVPRWPIDRSRHTCMAFVTSYYVKPDKHALQPLVLDQIGIKTLTSLNQSSKSWRSKKSIADWYDKPRDTKEGRIVYPGLPPRTNTIVWSGGCVYILGR